MNSKSWLLIGGGLGLTAFAIFTAKKKTAIFSATSNMRSALVDKMKSLVGTPYIWGGKTPEKGLDCSGAVNYVLESLGLVPSSFGSNTNANGLYHMAQPVAQPQPGDLAFFGSPSNVTHVMMVMDGGKLIGATGGGSATTSVAIANQQDAKVKVVSGDYRKDLVSYGKLPMVA